MSWDEKQDDNFNKTQLTGLQSVSINIPENIILNKELDVKRVSVFLYLFCKTSMDYKILFSIQSICNWLGVKLDKHKGRNTAADKITNVINFFNEENIISFSDDISLTSFIEAEFDKNKFANSYQGERFAKIYIDELNSIINYKKSNVKDTRLDNSIILLVFAFLRMRIPIRNNLAGATKRIEAYDAYYKTISNELGISEKIVSRAISVLNGLGLIYERQRECVFYIDKKGNKKFIEQTTIFCNTYKRIKDKNGRVYLVGSGKEYYITETNEKEKELERYKKRKYK